MSAADYLIRDDAIILPQSLSASDPSTLFELCDRIRKRTGDVILDASNFGFIDPLGLAALRSTLDQLHDIETLHVRFMDQGLINYLVRMDFFEGLEVEGIDTQTMRNPKGEPENCVELIRISDGKSEELASRLVTAMTGCQPGNEDAFDSNFEAIRHPIEYALKELLENALSHARRDGNIHASAWVACQHFQNSNNVRLAIVDNGCGFLATLRGHEFLANETDLAAINAALIERVSCNRGPHLAYETDSQNQGVGLTMTAKIANAANGHLVVASGNAWINTGCDLEKTLTDASWKGVAIAFACDRDKLPQINIGALLPAVENIVDDDINFD